jgi:hypothetical protein
MTSSIRPSAVRDRILRDHEGLRRQLDQLATQQRALEAGDAKAIEPALVLVADLLQSLSLHLELEDAVLEPALREIDAWGPIRAEDLLRHHDRQRAQLAEVAERSQVAQTPHALSAVLATLIADLRADMAEEEREVLDADLLCDDLVQSGEDG